MKIEGFDTYHFNLDSFDFRMEVGAFQKKIALTEGNVVSGVICHGAPDYRMIVWAALALDEPAPDKTIYGDANCDGEIDMSDAVLIMQALANPNKYGVSGTDSKHITDKGLANADVDTSSKGLTSNDALRIQEYLLHKITNLEPTE